MNSTHAREVFAIKYFEINFWICTIYYIYKYQDCGFTKIKRDCPMHSRRKLLSLEEIFWANMKHCAIAGNVDQITLYNQSPFLHQDWKSKYFLENAQIELKHICGLFIIFRKVKDLIIKVGEKFLLISSVRSSSGYHGLLHTRQGPRLTLGSQAGERTPKKSIFQLRRSVVWKKYIAGPKLGTYLEPAVHELSKNHPEN